MNESVASLRLHVEGKALTCLCLYAKQQLRVYSPLGVLSGGAGRCSSWVSFILLGYSNAYVSNDSVTWRGIFGRNMKLLSEPNWDTLVGLLC